MQIGLGTCLGVNIFIVFIFLILFIAAVVVMYFLLKKKSAESIDVFCSNIKSYIPYPPSTGLFPLGRTYSTTTASFLLTTDLNVTLHNCKTLGKLSNPPGFPVSVPFVGEGNKTIAYLFSSPAATLISFTGTFFFGQWITDLEAYQVDPTQLTNYESGIKVHSGFYELYRSIQNSLKMAVSKYLGKGQLIISGHSLGGALAMLCAFDLASYKPLVYTFASPRTGNLKFSAHYRSLLPGSTYRVFNTEDVVPTAPPPIFGKDLYEHIGHNIPFTNNLGTLAKNHIDAYEQYYGV